MKILAFSDLHRDKEAAEAILAASSDADVLVGAGDFANCGIGAEDTVSILKAAPCPAVLVAGNHDPLDEMERLCAGWTQGHLLHGNAVTLEGVTFFGLGFEIPSRNDAAWNMTMPENEAAAIFAQCPENAVLVTHTPPMGIGDVQRDGTHEGSEAILAVNREKQPLFNLCGHIHYSWGAKGHIGKTLVQNLGPTVNWFEV